MRHKSYIDQRTKIGKSSKARATSQIGFRNRNWKGDNVGYIALHIFMKKRFLLVNPQVCAKCGSTENIDLSNKSGEYKREMNDWQLLCRKCHRKYDNEMREGKSDIE